MIILGGMIYGVIVVPFQDAVQKVLLTMNVNSITIVILIWLI